MYSKYNYILCQLILCVSFAYSHKPILSYFTTQSETFSAIEIIFDIIFFSCWALCYFTYRGYYRAAKGMPKIPE